jgi:hypothetical protein
LCLHIYLFPDEGFPLLKALLRWIRRGTYIDAHYLTVLRYTRLEFHVKIFHKPLSLLELVDIRSKTDLYGLIHRINRDQFRTVLATDVRKGYTLHWFTLINPASFFLLYALTSLAKKLWREFDTCFDRFAQWIGLYHRSVAIFDNLLGWYFIVVRNTQIFAWTDLRILSPMIIL